MVEVLPGGETVTPSVWDLHLHHVVWLAPNGGPTFASGEEKTIATMPKGYGFPVQGRRELGHQPDAAQPQRLREPLRLPDLADRLGPRRPGEPQGRQHPLARRRRRAAGLPGLRRRAAASTPTATASTTFPDEVPTDPSEPGYEERSNISNARKWTVGAAGATLVFGAGHLHPGGKRVDLSVARDGPDAGSTPGNTPSEVRQLFRSDAKYYEPAGAVSWDVALEATPREWRISLKPGDEVSINVTYNVKKASWYESMGILPLAWSKANDPAARDPFDDAAEVRAMYEQGGSLTHGRLKENIDKKAGKNLNLPDPRDLKSAGKVAPGGIDINSFVYDQGGYSAVRGFPTSLMRPPVVAPGETRSASPTTTRSRVSPRPSRSGTASPPARPPVTRTRASATRSRTGRSSSIRVSSATAPGPAARSRPARTSSRRRR